MRVDGTVSTSDPTFTLPGSLPRSINAVGDGEYATCGNFSGQLSEIVLYRRALPMDEVAIVERYLREKWGCCMP